MLTFIPEIISMLLPIIKEDKEGRDKISVNPVDVSLLVSQDFFPSWNMRISGCFFTRYLTPSSVPSSTSKPENKKY